MASMLREDRIIPGLFIAFFVGLACLEATLITISIKSFTGLSENDPYRRGLRYNEVIEARTNDLALGWRIEIGFVTKGPRHGEVAIAVRDSEDNALKSPTLSAVAHRITDKQKAVPIALTLEDGAVARGAVNFSEPGRWFIKVRIAADGREVERIREIMVEGP